MHMIVQRHVSDILPKREAKKNFHFGPRAEATAWRPGMAAV